MTKTRAALFEEDDIDLSDFKAEVEPKSHFPEKEEVKAVSEQAGFSSREAYKENTETVTADTKRKPYNSSDTQKIQLNIRVTQEVADAFYRIARKNEWNLGQTLKKAVLALEKGMSLDT